MNTEVKKGEWPINWGVTSFSSDAKLVLKLRAEVKRYQQEHNVTGPVADLQSEQVLIDSSPEFNKMHNMVNQPIAFSLPTPILRVLSYFKGC